MSSQVSEVLCALLDLMRSGECHKTVPVIESYIDTHLDNDNNSEVQGNDVAFIFSNVSFSITQHNDLNDTQIRPQGDNLLRLMYVFHNILLYAKYTTKEHFTMFSNDNLSAVSALTEKAVEMLNWFIQEKILVEDEEVYMSYEDGRIGNNNNSHLSHLRTAGRAFVRFLVSMEGGTNKLLRSIESLEREYRGYTRSTFRNIQHEDSKIYTVADIRSVEDEIIEQQEQSKSQKQATSEFPNMSPSTQKKHFSWSVENVVPCGIYNPKSLCYLICIVQFLYTLEPFKVMVMSSSYKRDNISRNNMEDPTTITPSLLYSNNSNTILVQLRKIFIRLQYSQESYVDMKDLFNALYKDKGMRYTSKKSIGTQRDALQCLLEVTQHVNMSNPSVPSQVKDQSYTLDGLLRGILLKTVIKTSHRNNNAHGKNNDDSKRIEKQEGFYYLMLDIPTRPSKDTACLSESLQIYFTDDVVSNNKQHNESEPERYGDDEGEGDADREGETWKDTAGEEEGDECVMEQRERRTAVVNKGILKLPPVLLFAVRRFKKVAIIKDINEGEKHNANTQEEGEESDREEVVIVKDDGIFGFDEYIDMTPYLHSSCGTPSSTFTHTVADNGDIGTGTVFRGEGIKNDGDGDKDDEETLSMRYRLSYVFNHQGSLDDGHYYSYCRKNTTHTNSNLHGDGEGDDDNAWYRMDDDIVEHVTYREMYRDSVFNEDISTNVYMLAYTRIEAKKAQKGVEEGEGKVTDTIMEVKEPKEKAKEKAGVTDPLHCIPCIDPDFEEVLRESLFEKCASAVLGLGES